MESHGNVDVKYEYEPSLGFQLLPVGNLGSMNKSDFVVLLG